MARGGIAGGRLIWVFAAFLVCFSAVLYRLTSLQVLDQPELAQEAEELRERFDKLPARRGNIYDRNHNLLATTWMVRDVGVDPEMLLPEDKPKWAKLAQILDMDYPALYAKMKPRVRIVHGKERKVRWEPLAPNIDEKRYAELLKLEIKGVYGNRHYHRNYPGEELASHVLGHVNKNSDGVSGVEAAMDFYLSGQDGWLETERDGKRREMAQFRKRLVESTDGFHVTLTLDMMVQDVIERQLTDIVNEKNPDSATIIVSDPSTGYILGMANWPNYNPNHFNDLLENPIEHQRNLAITDLYEPGSTFKIVSVGAALSEGLVTPGTVFDCSEKIVKYQGRNLSLPNDWKDFDQLDIRDIIAYSSNRGAAHAAMALGDQKFYNYVKAFGFGEKTGFLLSGEVNGILHHPKDWDGLTISRMPMGHAVAVTPLQAHFSMSVLANDGILMTPKIISTVEDSEGELIYESQPKARQRVISSSAARTLSHLLIRTVSPEGTARKAQIPGMEVAGKTGTTMKINENGRYDRNKDVASFIGYFPASDPRLVITVVIDNPKIGASGGGSAAAPAFREVAVELINILGISPRASIRGFIAMDGRN